MSPESADQPSSSTSPGVGRIAVLCSMTKPGVDDVCRQLIEFAHQRGVEVTLLEPMIARLRFSASQAERLRGKVADCDLIVTLGGDGMLLHTVRTFYPVVPPVLAVNMGHLGFNTQCEPANMLELLEQALAGRAQTQTRTLLEMELRRGDESITTTHALNDVFLSKTVKSRIVHLHCTIGDHYACHYTGDGLIVATPTGSTAYNFGLGGPIIYPTANVFVISALSPTRQGVQPLVLPDELEVRMRWETVKDREQVVAAVDGQQWHELEPGDEVIITKAAQPLRLISRPDFDYFHVLHRKIGWGGEWN